MRWAMRLMLRETVRRELRDKERRSCLRRRHNPMTTARLYKDGNDYVADISGHAGYSVDCPDIVCAACSTLTYTLLQSCFSASCDFDYRTDDGSFFICVRNGGDRVATIFDTISQGFALLASKYPDNVALHTDAGERPKDAGDRPKTKKTRRKDGRRRKL